MLLLCMIAYAFYHVLVQLPIDAPEHRQGAEGKDQQGRQEEAQGAATQVPPQEAAEIPPAPVCAPAAAKGMGSLIRRFAPASPKGSQPLRRDDGRGKRSAFPWGKVAAAVSRKAADG